MHHYEAIQNQILWMSFWISAWECFGNSPVGILWGWDGNGNWNSFPTAIFGITYEILFQNCFSTSDCARNVVLLNSVSNPSRCPNNRFPTTCSLQFAWSHIKLIVPDATLLIDRCSNLVTFLKHSSVCYVTLTKKVKQIVRQDGIVNTLWWQVFLVH